MTINQYVKKWCDETYDIRKEDFYVENAYYVAQREWANGGKKHGIFGILVFIISMIAGLTQDISHGLIMGFVGLGISAICFRVFGMRKYDANEKEITTGLYISLAVILFVLLSNMTAAIQIPFAVLSLFLYIKQSIVDPIKFASVESNMKQKMKDAAEEEEARAKQSYAQWENQYKAFRYGIPENASVSSDPMMDEARKLFVDFTDSKEMLKTRYRQLAKKYHPDHGGDTKLFQCIITAYEEFGQKFA